MQGGPARSELCRQLLNSELRLHLYTTALSQICASSSHTPGLHDTPGIVHPILAHLLG
uniref:Uncharacterized protein n=1 Tax=Klebsiella phage BUCT640 TaxID=3153538 RepID=A0AAU7J8J2_9CAUD